MSVPRLHDITSAPIPGIEKQLHNNRHETMFPTTQQPAHRDEQQSTKTVLSGASTQPAG